MCILTRDNYSCEHWSTLLRTETCPHRVEVNKLIDQGISHHEPIFRAFDIECQKSIQVFYRGLGKCDGCVKEAVQNRGAAPSQPPVLFATRPELPLAPAGRMVQTCVLPPILDWMVRQRTLPPPEGLEAYALRERPLHPRGPPPPPEGNEEGLPRVLRRNHQG